MNFCLFVSFVHTPNGRTSVWASDLFTGVLVEIVLHPKNGNWKKVSTRMNTCHIHFTRPTTRRGQASNDPLAVLMLPGNNRPNRRYGPRLTRWLWLDQCYWRDRRVCWSSGGAENRAGVTLLSYLHLYEVNGGGYTKWLDELPFKTERLPVRV